MTIWYLERNTVDNMAIRPVPALRVALDRLDLAIIEQLRLDGRKSLTELAQILDVSNGTVRNRLERLLASEVIRISAIIDPAKLGFPIQVLIGVKASLAHMEEIEQKVPQLDEVTIFATLAGRFDFLVGGAFASDAHLRKFLTRKLSKIKGIQNTETLHILNLTKRTWQWTVPSPMTGDEESQ